jgi:hypothetical protein
MVGASGKDAGVVFAGVEKSPGRPTRLRALRKQGADQGGPV